VNLPVQPAFTVPLLLICEGHDDVCFFQQLINARRLPNFDIVTTGKSGYDGGNTKFGAKLNSIKNNPAFDLLTDILLVSDNDEDHHTSFHKICNQISDAEFEAPKSPLTRTSQKPSIMVMMLPLDQKPGNLELVCNDAAEVSKLGRAIASSVNRFQELLGADAWPPPRRGKFWLRSYLAATATDPFVPLSAVFSDRANHHLIPLTDRSFKPIADVLNSFASPPPASAPAVPLPGKKGVKKNVNQPSTRLPKPRRRGQSK
jgi:hypothetical protein